MSLRHYQKPVGFCWRQNSWKSLGTQGRMGSKMGSYFFWVRANLTTDEDGFGPSRCMKRSISFLSSWCASKTSNPKTLPCMQALPRQQWFGWLLRPVAPPSHPKCVSLLPGPTTPLAADGWTMTNLSPTNVAAARQGFFFWKFSVDSSNFLNWHWCCYEDFLGSDLEKNLPGFNYCLPGEDPCG